MVLYLSADVRGQIGGGGGGGGAGGPDLIQINATSKWLDPPGSAPGCKLTLQQRKVDPGVSPIC